MEKKIPGIESAVVAFLLAITGVALMFPLIQVLDAGVRLIVSMLWHNGLDASSLLQRLSWPSSKPTAVLVEIIVVWIFSLVSAFIPYAICFAVARQFRLFHWRYFVLCGVLTAIGPCFLFFSGMDPWSSVPYLGLHQYLAMLPEYVISGAIAGAICWLYLWHRMDDRGLASS
jgi:hypothetical protein